MDSDSTFEAREEIPVGTRMPLPFSRMYISAFLRRTDTGGYLYALAIDDIDTVELAEELDMRQDIADADWEDQQSRETGADRCPPRE